MKEGDKVYCSSDCEFFFTSGNFYTIDCYNEIDKYVIIIDNNNCKVLFSLDKEKYFSEIGELYYFDNIFISIKDIRKQKLTKIDKL